MRIHMIATVAAGVLGGAALVGLPSLALASQSGEESAQRSDMGTVMSDPQFQTQMKSFMSEMMSDPELQEQMRSMMSDAMKGMDGMDEGSMDGMDGGSGSAEPDDGTPSP